MSTEILVSAWIPIISLFIGSGILITGIKLLIDIGKTIQRLDEISRHLVLLNGQIAKNQLEINKSNVDIGKLQVATEKK